MPFGRFKRKQLDAGDNPMRKVALRQNQKKEVRKIVKRTIERTSEWHQYQLGSGFQTVYAGAGTVIIGLTRVTQGLQDNQRVADELTLQKIQIRLNMQNNQGAAANYWNLFRVMIFQYKNSDMAPSAGQLLNIANANGGVVGTFSSRNIDYLNTYNVIYDRVFKTEQGVASVNNYAQTGVYSRYVKITPSLRRVKRKIQYQAGTDSHTNGIWMLITTDQATIANNPSFEYDCNVNYTDK